MKLPFETRALVTCVVLLVFSLVGTNQVAAQPQPSGGKTTSAAASSKPAETTTKVTTSKPGATKAKSPRTTRSAPSATVGPAANIAGKWWTTGNGFGDSEVIFTQNGADVSGIIRYADGRTGSVTGRMVGKRLQHSWTNSSGQAGSGWLEQSWNNFLGGPWRNSSTRDGSWTLSRVQGSWCFGGSRSRIRKVTHDQQGRITMVTEDGSHEEGHLEGPWLFLHSDFGSIKGEMNYRHNRVTWSTGFYWTWCGQ